MRDKCIVFDLDDTLVYEIDFLKSAYREIAQDLEKGEFETMLNKYFQGENVFQYLVEKYGLKKDDLLNIYRTHFPDLELISGAKEVLDYCKNKGWYLGLITDGRSLTQRNKIKALGIENYFDQIIVSEEFGSEKPNQANYKVFHDLKAKKYIYIGDNIKKDFIAPNQLGWNTVCLLSQGYNIHSQVFSDYPAENQPKIIVRSLKEIIAFLNV